MVIGKIEITPKEIILNGECLTLTATGIDMLHEAYRQYINDYPKFFKMDGLCKLGFIASELLLSHLDEERFTPRDDRAVVLFNHSGSLEADLHYQSTISDPDNFFPSPSVFVYTLPNIVTGEIAIRNKYHGETSFYVMDQCNEQTIRQIVDTALAADGTDSVLTGWVDFVDGNHYSARIELLQNNK